MTEKHSPRTNRPLFALTIGLSAFLLFTLELLAGRLVLPVFGGAPSVWTTALCFFTGAVFLGSLYAHAVDSWLTSRAGGLLHLCVAGAVVAATLLGPSDIAALRDGSMAPALNVLLVLALVAGPPALLFSTTTPLLSAWFSQRGEDPWSLYAVSNAASLTGLLAYPLLIEPLIGLSVQRARLQWLMVALFALLAVVVSSGWRRPTATPMHATEVPPQLTVRRQLMWVAAAFMPAGLLSATTTLLTTDNVSAPLLWVMPLAVYLASMVVAFSRPGRRLLPVVEWLVPSAATLLWLPFIARLDWPVYVLLPTVLASFAALAIAIHGRLALDRPEAAHLTRFYLLVSAGGLLATTFVALVAPTLFSDVYELPLLLVGGLAVLAALAGPTWPTPTTPIEALRATALRLAPLAVVGIALVAPLPQQQAVFAGVVLAMGALVVMLARSPRALAVASGVAIIALAVVFTPRYLARERTFFGITEVRAEEGGAIHSEIHGTTLHGLQFTSGSKRMEPTAYFVRSGPLGQVFDGVHDAQPGAGIDIGVVGLGVGSMSPYARPTDSLSFFEIDQAVVELARDTHYFTYLRDAAVTPRVVVGDGRLLLAREPADSFDVILLDAFSSDAVPAHLLTREAMRVYMRALRPGGVLVFQLTNRHFDLAPAVASTARSLGLESQTRSYDPPQSEKDALRAQRSSWLVVARPADLERLQLGPDWSAPAAGPVLTDDHSDVLRLLNLR